MNQMYYYNFGEKLPQKFPNQKKETFHRVVANTSEHLGEQRSLGGLAG